MDRKAYYAECRWIMFWRHVRPAPGRLILTEAESARLRQAMEPGSTFARRRRLTPRRPYAAMARTVRRNPPPPEWFSEDTRGLRGPR